MITQEDTIFISGMNTDATEEDIATHFGAIGIIKVRRADGNKIPKKIFDQI